MDFRDYSISELAGKVQSKDISAKEITSSALSNIENQDKIIAMNDKKIAKMDQEITRLLLN